MIRLLALLLLALCSCKSMGGGSPAGVVGSVILDPTNSTPSALIRYDGNTLVAWGEAELQAEVYLEASGFPVLLRTVQADKVLVHVRKPEFSWEGKVGDPLPQECAHLFRVGEAAAWGLTFQTPFPPNPHPTP